MELRDIASFHLAALRAKLSELKALEQSMAAFVRSCDSGCAGGAVLDCTILDELGAPGAGSKALPSGLLRSVSAQPSWALRNMELRVEHQ
ncbi:MAG TPA: hypothetical protein VLJ19_14200 [Variovorax sp.]|nr:hypothetical protein [Variovorax sp.]